MGEPIAIFVLLKFSSLNTELGFQCDKNQGECHAKFSCHLDYFAWVKRDSYLPHESQGLKAVTKAKLGYDPVEVNPEDMVKFAKERPQVCSILLNFLHVAIFYSRKSTGKSFITKLGKSRRAQTNIKTDAFN
ncbi:hypothetical protein ACS0TY_028086 [Phlomoides rotata]